MNWKLFVAKHIYRSNEGGKEVSKPAIRIAMWGIAVGLAVMIIAVAVVVGFKNEVRGKVVGIGSDITVTDLDSQNSYETNPVSFWHTIFSLFQKQGHKGCTGSAVGNSEIL